MKRIILTLAIMLIATMAQAQSTGKIINVKEDEIDKSIVVESQYKVNGNVVNVFNEICVLEEDKYMDSRNIECVGRSRYKNTSGDDVAIIALAKKDVDSHTRNLIKRIPNNIEFIIKEREKRINELKKNRTSKSIILNIKSSLIGYEKSEEETIYKFKGKTIKVTYDEKNTVTDMLTP